jgi:4-aminobutyrate aminotransferase/(S)-3-amino-2-methylpropionate transaminase
LGGTYSGNPVACVAAIEAIEMIRQPDFLARANAMGQRLNQHLLDLHAEVPLVGDVRGLGPMQLMELVKDRTTKVPAPDETLALTQEVFKRGLIAIRAGLYSNCIRFLPPLNITDEQVDEGMAVIAEGLRVVEGKRQAALA